MFDFLSSNLFSALFGTFIGAYLSFWLTKRNDKRKLVMDFHKEWSGYEMSVHRRMAYHCIKKFPEKNYDELTSLDEKGSISLFIVMRFFERLWHCLDAGTLNAELCASLFSENFYWYYFITFNTSLKVVQEGWAAFQHIENLKCKFREYTSEVDYDKYKRKYTDKYYAYISENKTVSTVKQSESNVSSFEMKGVGEFELIRTPLA